MKDYLKNYIDTMSENWFEENSNAVITDRKSNREALLKEEADIIVENKMRNNTVFHQVVDSKPKESTVCIEKSKKKKIIKDNIEWNIYKERVLIKNLLHQRFNYFIIVYALTVLSASIVQIKINQAIILATGFFILSMLWFNLIRVYIEHQEIHKIFNKTLNRDSVLNIIGEKLEERQRFLSNLPMDSVLIYGLPVLCLLSIVCYLVVTLIF